MQKLALHVPINSLSLGQLSTVILRSLFEREKTGKANVDLYVIPIGNSDISSQNVDVEFRDWLQSKIQKTIESYTRDIPVFKIWHLNQSLESYSSKKQTLLSFYELDAPTKIELNIAKNNNLIFSSKYSCEVFNSLGANSNYIPLPFDSYSFSKLDKKFHTDDRIVFNICGKLEKRKHHGKAIQAWIKAFGNNNKYSLQCAIFNPFLGANQQEVANNNNEMIKQIVNGNKPFNVNFYPTFKENLVYNEFLNSADIILGVSSGEGWDLPSFQSVAIGKHSVILNAHAYKGWSDSENSVLLQPSGKEEIYDNIFFHKGQPFNQGSGFSWNENEFIDACKSAILRVEKNRINKNGLLLQEKFTKEKFVDDVINLSISGV
jgi:hypothetical protein